MKKVNVLDTNPIELRKCLQTIDLDGTLDSAVDYLANLKNKYESQGYYNFCIDFNYGDDYSAGSYELWGSRLETEEEVALRLKIYTEEKNRKKQTKEKIKEEELKLLAKLEKKYRK